jgi:hypothetical protein
MRVKVHKIDVSDNPEVSTALDQTLEAQDLGTQSPWVGYNVEGIADNPPIEGEPFFVHRKARNGKEIPGVFETSPVRSVKLLITGWQIETLNSLYWVERI